MPHSRNIKTDMNRRDARTTVTARLVRIAPSMAFGFWVAGAAALAIAAPDIRSTPLRETNLAQAAPFQSLQPVPDLDAADIQVRNGLDYQRRGQPDKAIEAWEAALDTYVEVFDFESMGRVYGYLGPAYVATGQYQEAEIAFAQQVSIARQRDDSVTLAYGLNNLGVVLLQGNDIDAAETVLLEALAESEAIRNPGVTATSLNNLGLVEVARGDFFAAIVRYETALKWHWEAEMVTGEASTYNNLGEAYWETDDYENTIGAYGAALTIARDSLDFDNFYRAIDGLVVAHQSVGRFFRAQDLLEERLELARRETDSAQELQTLRGFASLYTIAGEYDAAIRFYEGAIALAREIGDRPSELRLSSDLAQVLTVAPER
ncbi:MAG: tetratricopeptide repeat protein [Geitlerinemataceae cyanobacterium]